MWEIDYRHIGYRSIKNYISKNFLFGMMRRPDCQFPTFDNLMGTSPERDPKYRPRERSKVDYLDGVAPIVNKIDNTMLKRELVENPGPAYGPAYRF